MMLIDINQYNLIDNHIIDHDDEWTTPNMPALADVMSKVLRKRIKNDQVKPNTH